MKLKATVVIVGLLMIIAGFATFFLFQCEDARCQVFRHSIENLFTFSSLYAPCEKPITYRLGSFDEKFGLSKQSFLSAIKEAEVIWEQPIGKELFTYSENGMLKVNLIYDYRQEATSRLKSLGIVVKEDKASYDQLKEKYQTLTQEYTQAKVDYDRRVALFEQRKNSYDQEVRSWNRKGGALKSEYQRLQEEKTVLEAELAEIRKLEAGLRTFVDDINSLVVVLNRLVASLNLNVGTYNEIGASRGEEFTEGDYQERNGEQSINIYEFSSREKLVRVLEHEFGHALGLEHVEDPRAIMYRLNTSVNEKLTNEDLKELKTRCAIK